MGVGEMIAIPSTLRQLVSVGSRAAATLAIGLIVVQQAASGAGQQQTGILILAHGGSETWNRAVSELARQADERVPTEVALGMASRQTMQAAIDRLSERGVREITAVPLFISSHSSVIESTRYLLGLRSEAPADLAVFARMNHGANGASHAAHQMPAVDGTTPVGTPARIRMATALDDHRVVSDILTSRVQAISSAPASEVVVLVAHGPVPDDDNVRWLGSMRVLAERVGRASPFARVDYLTVRDDAPEPVRAAATEDLRAVVGRVTAEGRRALIVPLLLSYGGVEQGIRRRLVGLDYTMAAQGLMPDDRLLDWVLESAADPP
jgi:sirohydrochlorin ferrochelatase